MSRTIEVELFASISTTSNLTGTIVVATDGTHDADGAVRVGTEIGRREQFDVAVISVVEPPTFADDGSLADTERMTRLAIEAREGQLAAQRQRTCRTTGPFAIHVGHRVDEIVRFATQHDASLIVMGLGSHGVMARLLHRETALRVARTAALPVLAVPPNAGGVPRRALVGIDFSPSSETAARAALDLLADDGTLYLAHVVPRVPLAQNESAQCGGSNAADALGKLEGVRRRLNPPASVTIELVSLHGDPADQLLRLAERNGIDLVATGAHGRGALGRLVLGSVSTRIVRTAQAWVLVAPPQPSAGTEGAAEDAAWPTFDAQPIG